METTFYFKNMVPKDEENLRSYVLQKLDKLDRIVADYPNDGVLLEVKAERFEKHNAYDIELLLKIHGETFTAKEASHFITKAVDRAKTRLEGQLTKHNDTNVRKHRTVKAKTKDKVRAMAREV